MSQLDLLADLHAGRPTAPAALRDRVAAIAAAPAPPARRLTWRRAAVVLVPAVLAVTVGAVVLGGRGRPQTAERAPVTFGRAQAQTSAPAAKGVVHGGTLDSAAAPAPSRTRLQDYDATLSLHVRGPQALSDATKQAVRIANGLGGFAAGVQVDVEGARGSATLRLRVPVTKVQAAIQRLGELGRITGESVSIRDVQTGVNVLDRRIARLQRELRSLRAAPQTPATQRRIAALTATVERLQRGRAETVRQARLATIQLRLTAGTPAAPPKPAEHGPLHNAVVALRWMGIGALYALIVGGPVVLLGVALWLGRRAWRRRAERQLLERA